MINIENCQRQLQVNDKTFNYFSLAALADQGFNEINRLPYSLKVLLENNLRHADGKRIKSEHLEAIIRNDKNSQSIDIYYHPARILMQDFTGVPAVVDLAAMRDAIKKRGGDPNLINPHTPVDLVIDHSVQVDRYGTNSAYTDNVHIEMKRNHERYQFLRWAQESFDNFRVVPPGNGICHQVNVEYLAQGVWHAEKNGEWFAYPDTLVGTDSHTTMVNGLGVLGWGVGGIEAEAAMLGQPITMQIPEVIGVKLVGELLEGVTATDLVLTVTQKLREKGVVGKFVEYYGSGVSHLSVPDRATLANMAPEYGATCGFFPIDQTTIDYFALSSRTPETCELVKAYCQAQGLWHDADSPEPIFTDGITVDLNSIEPSLAGPKRPQDRVSLSGLPTAFADHFNKINQSSDIKQNFPVGDFDLHHGAVVIAAITSCTNTSNPSVMLAAGLIAKKAVEKGLTVPAWVKTSLAPGSKVVTDYLAKAGLQTYLDQLGFNLVGYGCTTCIGNSGPLAEPIANAIDQNNMVVSAVLSGNRNFEGRVHPQVKANWLASPPLVVAYAIAGTTTIDISRDSITNDKDGNPVYLRDIWPSNQEIKEALNAVQSEQFTKEYAAIFIGDEEWEQFEISKDVTYQWKSASTYIQNPPFFINHEAVGQVQGASILAMLGDSITTDHISPAGAIGRDSAAGQYLLSLGVEQKDFNSYGSRRGNHEIMMRGTFANVRLRNEMAAGKEGGYTRFVPSGDIMSIYDAAMKYQEQHTPLVVFAGKEYGTGSSRDWAAKGTRLLGVRAVIAESFERIHRSNLIGMGVLPLTFMSGDSWENLGLTGNESIDILFDSLTPGQEVIMRIHAQGEARDIPLRCSINTQDELRYYQQGGILQTVLTDLMQ